METLTPADVLEEKDWRENGHKESNLKRGRAMLSEKAWSRVPPERVVPAARSEPEEDSALSLRDAMTKEAGRTLSAEEVDDRLLSWHTLCRYVFQDGIANPWEAFKNFLAVVRRTNPEYIDSIAGRTLGMLLNESHGAPSAREIRIYEAQLREWGVMGFHGVGGAKPESAREKFSKAAQGNDSRKRGTELKRLREQGEAA